MSNEAGQRFRTAWIMGVKRHFPGEPKAGYIVPWEEMPAWEQAAATAVYEQVRQFIAISDGTTARLSADQRGQFVAACWNAQVHKHLESPKPSYVAPWEALPAWQREVDADIFAAIEEHELEG
ncbi:hypothetical protein [Glycomyces sp. NPDC047010]|uniref:hypothetical protein n=1 Tax=Glycomyces sp. NPDC047010 TaxID=3155023 RepID=UPI00340BE1FD